MHILSIDSLLEGELNLKVPLLLIALQQQVVRVYPAPVEYQVVGLELYADVFGEYLRLAVCTLSHHCALHTCLHQTETCQADIEVDPLNGSDFQGDYVLRTTINNIHLQIEGKLRPLLTSIKQH